MTTKDIKRFTIKDYHICSLTVTETYDMFRNIPYDQLTQKQLLKIIKGESTVSSIKTQDHPEFTKLRNTLHEQGYVEIETRSWNGDRVLKPFMLNDILFTEGVKFLSAGALRIRLDQAKKNKEQYVPGY